MPNFSYDSDCGKASEKKSDRYKGTFSGYTLPQKQQSIDVFSSLVLLANFEGKEEEKKNNPIT